MNHLENMQPTCRATLRYRRRLHGIQAGKMSRCAMKLPELKYTVPVDDEYNGHN